MLLFTSNSRIHQGNSREPEWKRNRSLWMESKWRQTSKETNANADAQWHVNGPLPMCHRSDAMVHRSLQFGSWFPSFELSSLVSVVSGSYGESSNTKTAPHEVLRYLSVKIIKHESRYVFESKVFTDTLTRSLWLFKQQPVHEQWRKAAVTLQKRQLHLQKGRQGVGQHTVRVHPITCLHQKWQK